MKKVLDDIVAERENQLKKWGVKNHTPLRWLPILTEEVGEVAKALCDGDSKNYRYELLQVAAVCVAAVESFDKGFDDVNIWPSESESVIHKEK